MLVASRLLEWVKSRNRFPGPFRAGLRGMLLGWKLARRLPLVNRLTWQVTVDGHRLRVRSFSYDDLLTVSPQYESCLADLLPPPGGIAVDAGAFIGRHTLMYARAVGPQGRVIALEPLPANYRLLVENVALNGYANVTCVPHALGRGGGQVLLRYEEETSTASTVRHLPRAVEVPQSRLDDLLDQLGIAQIDLLKIDVEGAEGEVLEGSRRILAASPCARVVVELHGVAAGADCPVAQWFLSQGYRTVPFHDGQRRFYLAEPAAANAPGPWTADVA